MRQLEQGQSLSQRIYYVQPVLFMCQCDLSSSYSEAAHRLDMSR